MSDCWGVQDPVGLFGALAMLKPKAAFRPHLDVLLGKLSLPRAQFLAELVSSNDSQEDAVPVEIQVIICSFF